jgi:hypothetical protein
LDEVPFVPIEIKEDDDQAVGLGTRGFGEADAVGLHMVEIIPEVGGVEE